MNTLSQNRFRLAFATGLIALSSLTALAGWKQGTALPDLGTFKLEGKLPDLAGKVVLVDFWASWCGPCKAAFATLEDLHKRYGNQGLVVLGINQDTTAKAMEKFLQDHPSTFPVVRDAGNKVVAAADVASMPTSFLVDRNGRIRYVHTGFHGDKTVARYETEITELLKEKRATKP